MSELTAPVKASRPGSSSAADQAPLDSVTMNGWPELPLSGSARYEPNARQFSADGHETPPTPPSFPLFSAARPAGWNTFPQTPCLSSARKPLL